MTSLHVRPSSKVIDFFIDRDGRTYGDEHERLRYYEAHSAMLQMMTILSMVVGAVALVLWPSRDVRSAVALVVGIPQLSGAIGSLYLKRSGVRLQELARASRKRAPMWLFFASLAAFCLAMLYSDVKARNDGTNFLFALLGVAVTGGLAFGLFLSARMARRAALPTRKSSDEAMDDN